MFNHFILAMYRDNDGKECFKRYGIHEIEELENVLEKCEFIAQCIDETTLSYVLVLKNVAERFKLKEYTKVDDSFFRHQKPFVINEKEYFLSMVFEVDDVQTLQDLGKDMIDFLKRTGGGYWMGPDCENSYRLDSLIRNSVEMIEEFGYYIYN